MWAGRAMDEIREPRANGFFIGQNCALREICRGARGKGAGGEFLQPEAQIGAIQQKTDGVQAHKIPKCGGGRVGQNAAVTLAAQTL